MNDRYKANWFPIEKIKEVTGMSVRSLRRSLSDVSPSLVRTVDEPGRGRPQKLYHYTADPRLAAHVALKDVKSNESVTSPENPLPLTPHASLSFAPAEPKSNPSPKPPPKPRGVARDDLVRADLRRRAVAEYEERRKLMSARKAALATCRDWSINQRVQTVRISERLEGGFRREDVKHVSLGTFQPGTLRLWSSLYKEGKDVLSLADGRKGHCGRKQKHIPDAILSYVYGISVSTPRADKAKAVAWAKDNWHGEEVWPDVSIDTWCRRIKAFDPRGRGKDLNHSVSQFMAKHSPDVEIDWNQLGYNERWEADDVREDWYAMASGLEYAMRPYAYAIMRSRTRKWVAFVATEAPITQAQFRELVGFAMASKGGGIPDVLKLERGAVAGDSHLDAALATLGCRVSRTGMDGGAVIPGACPDVATGHFQGKGLIERGLGGHHAAQWNAPAQVGTDERNTAPSRLQRYIKLNNIQGPVLLPAPEQWHFKIRAAFAAHDDKPCGGLPEIMTEAGEVRHASPNEMEKILGEQKINRMAEKLLPLFQMKGVVCTVTRNGFVLNNNSYGRFDEDLIKYDKVLAYASEVAPDVAYVHELGRCVELYIKAKPGDHEQYGRKMHINKKHRNQHEAVMAEALASGDPRFIESMMMLPNAVPDRPETVVAPKEMCQRADIITQYRAKRAARKAAFASRFSSDPSAPSDRSHSRRGLLAREEDLECGGLTPLSQPNTQEVTA